MCCAILASSTVDYRFRSANDLERHHRMVGRRHPTLGILTAFTISGLGHEYLFSITIGKVQGWQTLYFVVSGLAVAATYRLRPRGYALPLCIAATIAFNLLASVIFCQSLNEIVPFYSPRN
jgi:hypothetical protein